MWWRKIFALENGRFKFCSKQNVKMPYFLGHWLEENGNGITKPEKKRYCCSHKPFVAWNSWLLLRLDNQLFTGAWQSNPEHVFYLTHWPNTQVFHKAGTMKLLYHSNLNQYNHLLQSNLGLGVLSLHLPIWNFTFWLPERKQPSSTLSSPNCSLPLYLTLL